MFNSIDEVNKKCDGRNQLVVIKDGVYNLNSYMAEHPGGSEILEDVIGSDATSAFEGIGHSQDATNRLKILRIGDYKPNKFAHNTADNDIIESTDLGARTGLFISAIFFALMGICWFIFA